MGSYRLNEVEGARELVYLAPPHHRAPALVDHAQLRVSPSEIRVPRAPGSVWQIAVHCGNPGRQDLVGDSIVWGDLQPYLHNRDAIEAQFVRRRLPGMGNGIVLELVIDAAAGHSGTESFQVVFCAIARRHRQKAKLTILVDSAGSPMSRLIVEPSTLAFGPLPRLATHQVMLPDARQPARRQLVVWSADDTQQTYQLDDSDGPLIAVSFGGQHAALAYRLVRDARPCWNGTAVGRLALTRAGLCTWQVRPPETLRAVVRSLASVDQTLRVLRHPCWTIVRPDTLSLPAGGQADLEVTLHRAQLERGEFHGSIEIGSSADEPVAVSIPVSARVVADGPIADVTPSVLDFGYLSRDESRARELVIANRGTGTLAFELGDPAGAVGFVNGQVSNYDDRVDSTAKLSVVLRAAQLEREGPVEFDIPLKTTSHVLEQRRLVVRARAYVGELHCDPSDLSLLAMAYGDHRTLLCRILRADSRPVRLESLALLIKQPGPWHVAAELRDEFTFNLHIAAPTDPNAPPFVGSIQVRDEGSGLTREFPLRATLQPAVAELHLVLGEPARQRVAHGAVLRPADLANVTVAVHNIGKPRLFIDEIGYRPVAGPRLAVGRVPDAPVDSGQSVAVRICLPLAWLRRVFPPRRVGGTLFVRCRHHPNAVASLAVSFSVDRRRPGRPGSPAVSAPT